MYLLLAAYYFLFILLHVYKWKICSKTYVGCALCTLNENLLV